MLKKVMLMMNTLVTQFHTWLFDTGARVLEFINGASLIGYGLVFLLDNDLLNSYPIYYKFKTLPETPTMLFLIVLGLFQLIAMHWRGWRGETASGFALIVSAFVWLMIFAAFFGDYPPLNTGMVFPIILWLLDTLAGKAIMHRARELRHQAERGGV